jgi:2',3'-cyclic-nucleotide 2'-phosphodiesterase (5'-nucleotidase family)
MKMTERTRERLHLLAEQNMMRKRIFSGLFVLLILSLMPGCMQAPKLTKTEVSGVRLDSTAKGDEGIDAMIAPYKSTLEKEMNEVLVYSESEAVKGQPEGKLGNIVADLSLRAANRYLRESGQPLADICMLNNGGLRTSLPAGAISKGKIFELMPFENMLVVLTISGAQMKNLLAYIGKSKGVPVSGMQMKIDSEGGVKQVMIGGLPFDENKNYRVATSDYLAGGGDKMGFFKNPVSNELLSRKLRDALIEEMVMLQQQGKKLEPVLDKRISNE